MSLKERPEFLKEFSKEQSADKRKQLAQAIWAKRAEREAKEKQHQQLQESIGERQDSLAEQLQRIQALKAEIQILTSSGLKMIMNHFTIKKLRADLLLGNKTYEELKKEQEDTTVAAKTLAQESDADQVKNELEKTIEAFYKEQEEKWATSEYTREDVLKYFTEEHLASLSLDDFWLLQARFGGGFVTHVTRQGIRDHAGMSEHTAGIGQYSDGFMQILKDGRLRSPLGIALVAKEKEKAIAKFLQLEQYQTQEEALDALETFLDQKLQHKSGSFQDRSAIHVATGEVLDALYGSETENEIYILFPSYYIESQYPRSNVRLVGGKMNDQRVWANEERGMDINVGVVYIPAEARVDPETGSRYQIDKNKNPIIDLEKRNKFRAFVDATDFEEFADQLLKVWHSIPSHGESLEKLKPFRQKLINNGITELELQECFLENPTKILYTLVDKKNKKNQEDLYSSVDDILMKRGILFREPQKTVSSQEFWEAYFAKNPSQKPSKIVYYKKTHMGGERSEAGLHLKFFQEEPISQELQDIAPKPERFRAIAEKAIEEHFMHV